MPNMRFTLKNHSAVSNRHACIALFIAAAIADLLLPGPSAPGLLLPASASVSTMRLPYDTEGRVVAISSLSVLYHAIVWSGVSRVSSLLVDPCITFYRSQKYLESNPIQNMH